MHREQILKILKRRIAEAKRHNDEAAAHFNEVTVDSSAIPFPDGVARIRNAARLYRRAMGDLITAQHQMAVFLLDGLVPDDLDKSNLS